MLGLAVALHAVPTFAQPAPSLSEQVTSAQEGPMEGVVVSARKPDSTITISMATDEKGVFRFPAGRLDSGHYALTVRAAGYALDGAGQVDVAVAGQAVADLRLRPAAVTADTFTNAEWLASAPGPMM